MLWILATIAASATAGPALPGLDFLYSDQVAIGHDGEPQVAVGLATGETTVTIAAESVLYLDYFVDGQLRVTALAPQSTLQLQLEAARPAAFAHGVDVGLAPREAAIQAATLRRWQERGFDRLAIAQEGALIGLGGRVVDNRQQRLVIAADGREQAHVLAREVAARFAVATAVSTRMVEPPSGSITLLTEQATLPPATSYVRLRSDGPITVQQLEFARGYPWHGREDRAFAGDIYVVVDRDGTLAVVNVVGAEELLQGVVPSEMFASAPSEALKAQAIAARNHLITRLGRRHHGEPFHLCAEQHCQVYTGLSRRTPQTDAAVDATRGLVLFHHGALVHAVYASSCGGHTEDNDVAWREARDPALRGRPDSDTAPTGTAFDGLVRTVPKTYCNSHRLARAEKFRWQRRIENDDLRQLETRYPRLGRLHGVELGNRGPGGKLTSITLVGDRGRVDVAPELGIRQALGGLFSAGFVIDEERDSRDQLTALVVTGAGWGHGVGMCQMGAIGRAEAGHDFRRILGHYYNGAQTAALYGLSRTEPLQYRAAHDTAPDGWHRRWDGVR